MGRLQPTSDITAGSRTVWNVRISIDNWRDKRSLNASIVELRGATKECEEPRLLYGVGGQGRDDSCKKCSARHSHHNRLTCGRADGQ